MLKTETDVNISNYNYILSFFSIFDFWILNFFLISYIYVYYVLFSQLDFPIFDGGMLKLVLNLSYFILLLFMVNISYLRLHFFFSFLYFSLCSCICVLFDINHASAVFLISGVWFNFSFISCCSV